MKHLLLLLLVTSSASLSAQSIIGLWRPVEVSINGNFYSIKDAEDAEQTGRYIREMHEKSGSEGAPTQGDTIGYVMIYSMMMMMGEKMEIEFKEGNKVTFSIPEKMSDEKLVPENGTYKLKGETITTSLGKSKSTKITLVSLSDREMVLSGLLGQDMPFKFARVR